MEGSDDDSEYCVATGGQRGMTGEDLSALLTNGTAGGQSSGQLPNTSVASLWGEGSRKFLRRYFHILEHPACLPTD